MGEETPPPRPPPPKPSLSRNLMIMMVVLTIFVMFDANLRYAFGLAAGAVFAPTIGFGGAYPLVTLLLAGTLTTTISSILRHYFTDWVKVARTNKQMTAIRKATMDALRRGNPGKVQKLREMQLEMQKNTMDVSFAPMKSMAFTFLMFIIVFAWLSNFVYVETTYSGRLLFAVPWSTSVDLLSAYAFPSWVLLYGLFAIPIGQIVGRLLKYVSFRKRLAARDAAGE